MWGIPNRQAYSEGFLEQEIFLKLTPAECQKAFIALIYGFRYRFYPIYKIM